MTPRLFHILIVCALLFQGCSNHYSAQSIEGWVVDADTKQPVEGVVVDARWDLVYGMEGGYVFPMTIMETVTDKHGRFFFPAWGPKEIPEKLPSEARLKNSDPELQLFKSGYKWQVVRNDRPITSMGGHGASVRSSDWNGKKIPLIQLRATQEDPAILPDFPNFDFVHICEWKEVPRMVVETVRERERLEKLKIPFIGSISKIDDLPRQDICGSAKSFFKDYLK